MQNDLHAARLTADLTTSSDGFSVLACRVATVLAFGTDGTCDPAQREPGIADVSGASRDARADPPRCVPARRAPARSAARVAAERVANPASPGARPARAG